VCLPPSSFVNAYICALNFLCGVIDPGALIPDPSLPHPSLSPATKHPTLSPACAWSNIFRNISTPVTTVFRVSPKPTISTSSPTFTVPRSTLPVTTVPRPSDRKYVLYRQQKRLVYLPHRLRYKLVHRLHQLPNRPSPLRPQGPPMPSAHYPL
jgi:hypothetical protein